MLTRIGKFELQRLLGQGSMGEVYLALDPGLGRQVALKTILQGNAFGSEGAARFEREAKAMAALNHPGIVTLFDFGEDAGTRYLVMEYLEGEDLAALIERREPGKAVLLEALAQACEGLAYAHGQGFVHRDVKPGNIRVVQRGDRIQAKLMDFGIAAVERSELTLDGSWMGTVSYMAPEYLDSGKAAASADLFAAGVILYEILASGRKPFTGDTTTGILNAILRLPPAALGPGDLADLPAGLLAVMEQALAKDPAHRHPSATALAAAIRSALAAPPAAPPRPAAAPRQLVVGRGPRANCLSLRVALRQAPPAGTILVLPGLYRETLVVDKDITLRGEGEAGAVQLPEGITVAAGASLTLANATVGNGAGAALRLLAGSRVRAEDACFREAAAGGVELGPGAHGEFLRCQFSGNGSAGLLALEDAEARLEDCDLGGNQDAGLHGCGRARIHLQECRLAANLGLGIAAVDSAAVTLERCALDRNQGPGLLLDRGGSGRLEGCTVTGGDSLGVVCRPGSTLALSGCNVAGNALGGLLLPREALAPALGPGNTILDPILHG